MDDNRQGLWLTETDVGRWTQMPLSSRMIENNPRGADENLQAFRSQLMCQSGNRPDFQLLPPVYRPPLARRAQSESFCQIP